MLKQGEMALVFLFAAVFWLIVFGLATPNYLEKLTDPLNIFTLVLAVSTGGLWLANNRQLAFARDALALTRQELALAREDFKSQSWRSNLELNNSVNMMLKDDPSLFHLFEIDPDKAFEEDGITVSELAYIFAQLNNSLRYHLSLGEPQVSLTEARKFFLRNKKVQLAWKNYLRNVYGGGPWVEAVDAHIAEVQKAETKKHT